MRLVNSNLSDLVQNRTFLHVGLCHGLMGHSIPCDSVGPAPHETIPVVGQESRDLASLHRGHNCLEMLAVFLSVKRFSSYLKVSHTSQDKQHTVVPYLNDQGVLCSRPLCRLARHVVLWA